MSTRGEGFIAGRPYAIWWLLVGGLFLAARALPLGSIFALAQVVLLFGPLAELLNALQNASITRAVGGSPAIGEPAAFKSSTILMIAGGIGTILRNHPSEPS